MVEGHGLRTWAKGMVEGRGLRTWSKGMVKGHGQRTWAKDMVEGGKGHGRGAKAKVEGHMTFDPPPPDDVIRLKNAIFEPEGVVEFDL
jgi:hypothetical protein